MQKHQITQENDIVSIGNVVLTKQAISTLEYLQEESNECIAETLAVLGNAVCFLAKTKMHWGGSWVAESESLIQELSFVHGYLSDLKKPAENKLPSKFEETAKRDHETK
jgi:hypothetical protein